MRIQYLFKLSILFILFLSPSMLLFSDTIYLKSGKVIEGKIVSQNSQKVDLEKENGKKTSLSKKSILRIVYKDPETSDPDLKKENTSQKKKIAKKETEFKSKKTASTEKKSQNEITNSPELAGIEQKLDKMIQQKEIDLELRKEELSIKKSENDRFDTLLKREEEILSEEKALLKENRYILQEELEKERKERALLEKRVTELELKNRRLEMFLSMDEGEVAYYSQKRDSMDIVKRSMIFPGWGQRYAKDEFSGNAFSVTFLTTFSLGLLSYTSGKYSESNIREETSTTLSQNAFLLSQVSSTNSSLSGYALYSSYQKGESKLDDPLLRQQFGKTLLITSILVYGANLLHAYYLGNDWAKITPKNYPGAPASGWYWDLNPESNPNHTNSSESRGVKTELGYGFLF